MDRFRAFPAARVNVSEPCDQNAECRLSGSQASMVVIAIELSDPSIRPEDIGVFGLGAVIDASSGNGSQVQMAAR